MDETKLSALALVRACVTEDVPTLRLVSAQVGAGQLAVDLATMAAELLRAGCEDEEHALAVLDGWSMRVAAAGA